MKNRTKAQWISLVALHSCFLSSWGLLGKRICVPVLSCHSCMLAWFACPIGILVHYSAYQQFPFLVLGTIFIVGALFGRILCGWVCPFGLVQDLLYKIPSPKFSMPGWATWGKYVVLVLMVFLFPFLWSESTMYSFCRVCPAAALQVTIPNMIMYGVDGISAIMAVKLGVLVLVLGLAVFSFRSFCKVFCPIGALMAPLNLICFWTIKAPARDCISCLNCDKACKMEGAPSTRMGQALPANRHPECMYCYDCDSACKSVLDKVAAVKEKKVAATE